MPTIDRGDSHYEAAGDWEPACRHIGWFLAWAASRNLAAPQHRAERILPDPGAYIMSACDGKFIADDLTDDGNVFAEQHYGAYLGFLDSLARGQGTSVYEMKDDASTMKEIVQWLDGRML